ESETADRPVPIISFIARQRDLRELVGDHLPGAERLSFSDTLKWSEGRFDTISLDDRNLPAIARQRLLQPRGEDAKREIDGSFEETRRVRADVFEALLGREGDPQSFRDVYPFSPALVQALVAISSALQRERTALRVMLQLLVDQRDTLKLGDLVPVGDLFDVIADGDEPFTEGMRIHFERAKRLYHQKLLPILERRNGLSRGEARALPYDDPRATAFRGDDRLVKTLLLAALTPEVEAFRGLTAARLAALNHGSIRSPIPGGEARMVVSRFREWAAQVGEIKLAGDTANPTIALQLSGVHTETILANARNEDNDGNRRRALKTLLYEQLGLPVDESLFLLYDLTWRGTQRQVEIVFANIRELPFDTLRAKGEDWKVIIDFPFDTERRTANDDLAKLEGFREEGEDTATFCWVPAFFSHGTLRDLGNYVVLDFLLTGERFSDHASHLNAVDRAAARAQLDNQRSQLRQRLINALEAAYGIASDTTSLVDSFPELARRFQSLDRRFQPQPPAAPSLKQALERLLDQIFSFRFPRHPRFEAKVQSRDLKRVLDVARRAARAPQGRLEVEKELRQTVRQIANPLDLGEMHEAAFVLSDTWRNQLTRAAAAGGENPTVGKLRTGFDQPEPRGLSREVQDLLILVFAEQTNRSFFRYGGPVTVDIGQLTDEVELREQKLLSEAVWNSARAQAEGIFGLAAPSFLSVTNMSLLTHQILDRVNELRKPCSELVETLRSWMSAFGVEPGAAPRLRTAQALQTLVEDLAMAPPDTKLETLATAAIVTSAEAMGNAGAKAAEVLAGLVNAPFPVLGSMRQIADERRPAAEAILEMLKEALKRDELVVSLKRAVEQAVAEAAALLAAAPRSETISDAEPEPAFPQPGWKLIRRETREGLDAEAAADLFRQIEIEMQGPAESRLRLSWTVEGREKP
ncbi:MAG TPA: phage resistance protein, partial [Thermoanaerobaculia bacterium]|nr:phage resistance protein [Thermoanaerobaculia bacterium]